MPATPLTRRLARLAVVIAAAACGLVAAPASAQTGTIGEGTVVDASRACPGDPAAVADTFSVGASIATSISRLTVALYPSGAYSVLDRVSITTEGGAVVAQAIPTGDLVAFNFASPLAVGTSPAFYRVTVMPKAHAVMPPAEASTRSPPSSRAWSVRPAHRSSAGRSTTRWVGSSPSTTSARRTSCGPTSPSARRT